MAALRRDSGRAAGGVRRQGGDPADGDVAVAVRFEGRCFNDGYVLPPPSPLPLEDEEDHMLWSSEDDDDDNIGTQMAPLDVGGRGRLGKGDGGGMGWR